MSALFIQHRDSRRLLNAAMNEWSSNQCVTPDYQPFAKVDTV